MTNDIGTLTRDWVSLQRAPEGSAEHDRLFWAHEAPDRLIAESPVQAFAAVLQIVEIDGSDLMIANLAAGPLEDLLARHGRTVIADVERQAKADPAFRRLLSGVWRNDIDDDVWARVLAARKPGELL